MKWLLVCISAAIAGGILKHAKIATERTAARISSFLFYIGLPIQVLSLTFSADLQSTLLIPAIAAAFTITLGSALSLVSIRSADRIFHWARKGVERSDVALDIPCVPRTLAGSMVLGSCLGNSSWVGMVLFPQILDEVWHSWIAAFGVTHSVLGSYAAGPYLAAHYGSRKLTRSGMIGQILKMPTFWAFVTGLLVGDRWAIDLSPVKPPIAISAFFLLGTQLTQLERSALLAATIPATIKTFLLPTVVGLLVSVIGVAGEARLTLVLLSSLPSALISAILAQRFNLSPTVAAGTILASTLALPFVIIYCFAMYG